MSSLRIGINDTRVSRLAAERIRDQLAQAHAGLDIELVGYEGEASYAPKDPEAKIRALQGPLADGSVDLVIHQLKEIPVRLPREIRLVGVTERLTPFDAFLSERWALIDEIPAGGRLGYSHPRQKAQLMIPHFDLELVELHGSVDSRLQQMASRELDGLVISAEDLELVGMQDRIREVLSEALILPGPGAGCLGFLTRRADDEIEELLKPVEDSTSRLETMAERAFLDQLGGNPELSVGVRAAMDSQSMIVEGFLGTLDGSVYIRDAIQGPSEVAKVIGANLARLLLALGDEELHGLVAEAS